MSTSNYAIKSSKLIKLFIIFTLFLSLSLVGCGSKKIEAEKLINGVNKFNDKCLDPDLAVPKEWADFQKEAINRVGNVETGGACYAPFRYVVKELPQEGPKTKLSDSANLQDISNCELTRTDDWQKNEMEGVHFKPDLRIQIIPFQTLDFAATSNPQIDYKDWFDFVKNSFTQMTDDPSNYQIFIPDHYVQLDKNITSYDVGDKGVQFRDLNVDNFNKKEFERLIRDLIKVSEPEIDFAGADQFWFVGPPNISRNELVNWGNKLSIQTGEGDWHSYYVTDHIYSFDSPSWNFAGPYGTLHEVMKMSEGTLNGHFGLDGQSGTYPWGNEPGGWTDYLVWDKWLAKMVSDKQVMCAKPGTSGTYWIRPNAVKTDQEKLLMIPISETKAIAIESMRNAGFSYKVPKCQLGTLIYTIDTEIMSKSKNEGVEIQKNINKKNTCSVSILETSEQSGEANRHDNALVVGQSLNVLGHKITVVESGDFGDVVQVEPAV